MLIAIAIAEEIQGLQRISLVPEPSRGPPWAKCPTRRSPQAPSWHPTQNNKISNLSEVTRSLVYLLGLIALHELILN